ncbi:replication factor A protein 2 [Physocladia obscura]|uniref:Replication factor A protein 2 n=1 Tax=Physocladia obscura TaxID=109957 RepID=A0AAD5T5I7_9FUNG|nr:replication factor A protein 2 [Physocladia obscura]
MKTKVALQNFINKEIKKQVRIIGRVSKASVNSTSTKYTVSDGLNNVDCSKFMDQDNIDECTKIDEGTYVKVIGSVKLYRNTITLTNIFALVVSEFNEITFHNLECVYIHLLLRQRDQLVYNVVYREKLYKKQKQQPTSNLAADEFNAFNAYDTNGGSRGGGGTGMNDPFPQFHGIEKEVMLLLKKAGNESVFRGSIFVALRGSGDEFEIENAVEQLLSDSNIFDDGNDSYKIAA